MEIELTDNVNQKKFLNIEIKDMADALAVVQGDAKDWIARAFQYALAIRILEGQTEKGQRQ